MSSVVQTQTFCIDLNTSDLKNNYCQSKHDNMKCHVLKKNIETVEKWAEVY